MFFKDFKTKETEQQINVEEFIKEFVDKYSKEYHVSVDFYKGGRVSVFVGSDRDKKTNNTDDDMSNKQAINLLLHIGNNISKIADNEEDAEVYLKAIDRAVNALK